MIIKAYDNGFGINLGDEFIHDNRKWVVTGFDLDNEFLDDIHDGMEIEIDSLGDETFKHECPECGFKFN